MLKMLVGNLRTGLNVLFCINLPVAVVGILFSEWWLPDKSVEEQVLFVGIPIALFCLGVRIGAPLMTAVIWPRHRQSSQMEIEGTRQRPAKAPRSVMIGAIALLVAIWLFLMAPMVLLATPIYAWLDMPWALSGAFQTALALMVTSGSIVVAVFAAAAATLAWSQRAVITRRLSVVMETYTNLGLRRLSALF